MEALRTIDRLRLQSSLSPEEAAARRAVVDEWLEAVDLVVIQGPIFGPGLRAVPTALGTLDVLHLATALVWCDRMRTTLVMATHDGGHRPARSFGIEVLGA